MNGSNGNQSTVGKQYRLDADLASLREFPGNMGCFELAEYTVDKWSTIQMKHVHYSVPDSLVGEKVSVKIYSEKIVILSGRDKVVSHQRSYHPGDWCVKLEHYLRTFQRKSGALTHSVAWHTAHEGIRKLHEEHFLGGNKDFVMLLSYAKENGFSQDDLVKAATQLCQRGVKRISAEQLKAMLQNKMELKSETENSESDPQEAIIERAATGTLDTLTALMGNDGRNIYQSTNL